MELLSLIRKNKGNAKEFLEQLHGHPNFKELTALTGKDVLEQINVGDIVLMLADNILKQGE